MNKYGYVVFLFSIVFLSQASFAKKFDELASTPQMGWNSWNNFDCNVNEQMVKEMADAMVALGLKDAGYEYINIDDCWHGERDKNGFIQENLEHFPSGMKALADYIHSKGLKLGIYSDAGTKTCAGKPGSRGYEYQDAITYAKWGVDYLKYDWCHTENVNPIGAYSLMRDAIYAAKRPILFSMCEWGDNKPWEWASDVAHSWRTTGDIYPCWNCEISHGSWSSFGVLNILDKQEGLRKYAGPGHWNDMDMMEVGNGMSYEEDKAHFSIWAMMASPLIAGNDLRTMTETTRRILTNKAMIDINQDPLGIQSMKYIDEGDFEIWVKPLKNKQWAVMFLNRSDEEVSYSYNWQVNLLKDDIFNYYVDFNKTRFDWQSVWGNEVGSTDEELTLSVPAHGVQVLRLVPREIRQ